MADVLIHALAADRDYASALARAFFVAGLRAEVVDEKTPPAPNAVSVFVMTDLGLQSQALVENSVRAATQRRAVVARFTYRPVPLSLYAAPAFGLVAWEGDPGAPELDGLIAAAERLSPRLPDGVAPSLSDEPPPVSFSKAKNPLVDESAAWRAIQSSTDPADFEGFLRRFGPDSPFADLANLKLTHLRPRPQTPRSPSVSGAGGPFAPPPPFEAPDWARPRQPPPRASKKPEPPPREKKPEPTRKPPKGGGGGLAFFAFFAIVAAGGGAGLGLFDLSSDPTKVAAGPASFTSALPPAEPYLQEQRRSTAGASSVEAFLGLGGPETAPPPPESAFPQIPGFVSAQPAGPSDLRSPYEADLEDIGVAAPPPATLGPPIDAP